MARSNWLVNSNRSKVKRFIENTNNKDQFFKYMFIDSWKVTSTWGKEPLFITSREELKIEHAREEWQKLIAHGWRKAEEILGKRELGLLIFKKWLNVDQAVRINIAESTKKFAIA